MVDQLVRFDTHIDYVYLGSTAQETWKCEQVQTLSQSRSRSQLSSLTMLPGTPSQLDVVPNNHRHHHDQFTIDQNPPQPHHNTSSQLDVLAYNHHHHHDCHPKPPSILTIIIKGAPPPLHGLGPQAGHCEASAQRKRPKLKFTILRMNVNIVRE